MTPPFQLNQRIRVTDSNDGKTDDGTIIKVWPQYVKSDEPWVFDVKLDKPWHGNDAVEVWVIGRTAKQLTAL